MAIDYEDPGEMDVSLLSVPGLVNALKDHTLATAHRPNPKLAFAGALAMTAHLMGRTYRDAHDTRPNLDIVALGGTAVGKEAARKTNKALAHAIGADVSLGDQIGSAPGLEDQLVLSPATLFQVDECDTFLGALRSSNDPAGKLHQMILEFYSSSSSVHKTRALAGGKTATIVAPSLCLYGTAIPEYCYQAMNERSILDGLLGRFLFISAGDFCRYGDMRLAELPSDAVEDAKYLWERERTVLDATEITPSTVPYSSEAAAAVTRLFREADDRALDYRDKGLKCGLALWARLPEKVLKLALVHAVSENPRQPEITLAAVTWARQLVEFLTREMLYNAQFWVAEGSFDRLKKRALAMLANAPGQQMSRTDLLRSLHIDAQEFQRVLNTLHQCDQIEEEPLSRRKTIITLKDAA